MEKDEIIRFIFKNQMNNGEFRSFCYLPGSENDWYYSGDSPFVTANILYSIKDIEDENVEIIVDNGLKYLSSLQEKNGLWRYWKHNNEIMEYNVPCDVDDSALVAFLFKKIKKQDVSSILNKIKDNQSSDGSFYTWFIPRLRHLNNLSNFIFLVCDLYKCRKVFLPNKKIPNNECISSILDNEPAVNAHVIMAMGYCKEREESIKKIMDDILSDRIVLQYYDHRFFVYYHISRAYKEGAKNFIELKEKIVNQITLSPVFHEEEFFILNILNLITLFNFGFNQKELICDKIEFIENNFDSLEKFKPYKYWTSKQRSWWAGSKELTAALYLEYKNYVKLK